MSSFDLTERVVGARVVRALCRAVEQGPVALDCRGAQFEAALDLTGAAFSSVRFDGATFRHGCRLRRCEFLGLARFDALKSSDLFLESVTFFDPAWLIGIDVANLRIRDSEFRRYAAFDNSKLRFGQLRDVRFLAEARFRAVECVGPLVLRNVAFGGPASFQDSALGKASFLGCAFAGPLQTQASRIGGELSFHGSRFDDNRALELRAGGEVDLGEATFEQPLALAAVTPLLDAKAARFKQGVDMAVGGCDRVRLTGAALDGPSRIVGWAERGMPAGDPGRAVAAPKLQSLDGTRVDRLTLEGLDLGDTRFAGLHRLDDVLVGGRRQLRAAPALLGRAGREVLADEAALRCRTVAGGAKAGWYVPARELERDDPEPAAIAEIYRALRKAREDANDHPGAADFYYGEMEMRRLGAHNPIDRIVLTLYWLVSGYGLRAGRAVTALLVTVLALAVGVERVGVVGDVSYERALAWTLSASTSLTRSPDPLELTTAGLYLQWAARILGPALLALVVLALRSRVKR